MVDREDFNLFSYIVNVDWGFAPNPFWNCCTLVCCKKGIRKIAKEGDWILGTGSVSNNFRKKPSYKGKIIYAMKVSKVVSMQKYYEMCKGRIKSEYYECLKNKIPKYNSENYAEKMGDCIYYNITENFDQVKLFTGLHSRDSMKDDLEGKNAIISNHFYYFGKDAKTIPEELLPIVVKYQGYKYKKNIDYIGKFIEWIESGEFEQYKNPKDPKPILEDYKDKLPIRQKDKIEKYTCDKSNEVKVIKQCK